MEAYKQIYALFNSYNNYQLSELLKLLLSKEISREEYNFQYSFLCGERDGKIEAIKNINNID